MNNTSFIGERRDLVHYANKAVVDAEFIILNPDGTDFDFTGYTGLSMKIFDRREGTLWREWDGGIYSDTLSISGNVITWNTAKSEMDFDLGKYYHELSWYNGDGIEVVLLYGTSKFI